MPRKVVVKGKRKTGRPTAYDRKQDKRIKKLHDLVGNPEFKNLDQVDPDVNTANGVSIQSTNDMIVTSISNPPVGQSGSSRIGDKILAKYLEVKLSAWFKGAVYAQFVRFVCFVDRGYNETTTADPAGGDILQRYNDTTDGSLFNFLSPLHHDNFNQPYDTVKSNKAKNYKLIFDVTLTPPTQVGTDLAGLSAAPHVHKTIRRRLNNIIYYNGSDEAAGRICLAIFPGNSNTNTNNPYFNYYTRIAYVDM